MQSFFWMKGKVVFTEGLRYNKSRQVEENNYSCRAVERKRESGRLFYGKIQNTCKRYSPI